MAKDKTTVQDKKGAASEVPKGPMVARVKQKPVMGRAPRVRAFDGTVIGRGNPYTMHGGVEFNQVGLERTLQGMHGERRLSNQELLAQWDKSKQPVKTASVAEAVAALPKKNKLTGMPAKV